MPTPGPAQRRVMRIQFGLRLARWRERAGIQSKDAAKALGSDPSRLSRLERGAATIKAAEVDRLLDMYGVPAAEADELRALGAEARRRSTPMHLPEWAQTYVAMESFAAEIKIYDGEVIPVCSRQRSTPAH